MTKGELLEALKDMSNECLVTFWNERGCVTFKQVDCDGVLIYLEDAEEVTL